MPATSVNAYEMYAAAVLPSIACLFVAVISIPLVPFKDCFISRKDCFVRLYQMPRRFETVFRKWAAERLCGHAN
jgi:hypothetical protein